MDQVELTWDETDRRRQVLLQKFSKDDLEKMDIKDFLAGSSSEDEGTETNHVYPAVKHLVQWWNSFAVCCCYLPTVGNGF